MKILAFDLQARFLSEDEILALLREPIPMRLGMVDGKAGPSSRPSGTYSSADSSASRRGRPPTRPTCCARISAPTSRLIPAGTMGTPVVCEDPPPYGSSTVTLAWRSTWLARDC